MERWGSSTWVWADAGIQSMGTGVFQAGTSAARTPPGHQFSLVFYAGETTASKIDEALERFHELVAS